MHTCECTLLVISYVFIIYRREQHRFFEHYVANTSDENPGSKTAFDNRVILFLRSPPRHFPRFSAFSVRALPLR
jgi:hypothetical protein